MTPAWINLQRPSFWIRSDSQVLRDGTSTCLSGGHEFNPKHLLINSKLNHTKAAVIWLFLTYKISISYGLTSILIETIWINKTSSFWSVLSTVLTTLLRKRCERWAPFNVHCGRVGLNLEIVHRAVHTDDLTCWTFQTSGLWLRSSFTTGFLNYLYWKFLPLFYPRSLFVWTEFLLGWQNAIEDTLKMLEKQPHASPLFQAHNGRPAAGKFSFCSWPVQTTVWEGASRQCPLLSNLSLHLPVTCSSRHQRWHSKRNWTGKPHTLFLLWVGIELLEHIGSVEGRTKGALWSELLRVRVVPLLALSSSTFKCESLFICPATHFENRHHVVMENLGVC